MYLKGESFQRLISLQSQGGFLIPLALILLVGISFLAIAVNRLSAQSNSSATLEGLSAQAFYAAESGGQRAMNQLFFGVSTRSQTDTNCTAINGDTQSFAGIAGLGLCDIALQCVRATNPGNTISYYTITSAAVCSGGDFVAERTIQISSYMRSP